MHGGRWSKQIWRVVALVGATVLVATLSATAQAANGYLGRPPVSNHGGPVLGTGTTPGSVTVTPVYWDPASSLASSYKSTIDQFVTDVSADDGTGNNVYSDELQYGIHYDVHAGTPVIDSDAFPSSGCTPDTGSIYADTAGYSTCLTDAQIQSEVSTVLTNNSLPSDLADLYMLFLPEGVEVCKTASNGAHNGLCSINPRSTTLLCGYHSSMSGSPPIYAALPFPIYNSATRRTCGTSRTPGYESPNSQPDADVEISWVSAETIGATTDPEGTTWYDRVGREVNDDCRFIYGSVLGGTTPGGLYNQVIDGHHYFLQEELSNEDYRFKRGHSCIQRIDLPVLSFRVNPPSPTHGHAVRLNAKLTRGTITNYAWNFGDSSTGSGKIVAHTYHSAGTYTITLTVTDTDGLESIMRSFSKTVTVR